MPNIPFWVTLLIQILGVAVGIFGTPALFPGHELLLAWIKSVGVFAQAVSAILAHYSQPQNGGANAPNK